MKTFGLWCALILALGLEALGWCLMVLVILAALMTSGCYEMGHFDNTRVTCKGRVVYTDVEAVMLGGGAVDVYRRGSLLASLPPGDECRVDRQ